MMLKAKLIKLLDRWLGVALVRLFPRPKALSPALPPCSILLIRPGGIGDAVLLAKSAAVLRVRYPEAMIDILAERRNSGAFALIPGIHEVLCYDHLSGLFGVFGHRYDAVIDTEQWHRLSAVVARFVRAPVKIGFATNQRARMFTHAIPYNLDDYEAVSFLRLLQPLGINVSTAPEKPWLQVPAAARQSAAPLLPEDERQPMVVIFPGASIPEKLWGKDRFLAVARWCGEQGLRVVLIGGGGEQELCARIAAAAGVVNLAGKTSLVETAAVLERAAVVVSGDSGVLHIAAGLGRPTVSLFGPSCPGKWGPQGVRHIVLRPADCSPCAKFSYTPACPHGVCCMRAITVDDVTKAVSDVLRI